MMLTGEHGLAAVEPRPVLAAIATFVVFVICGLIPLLPFLAGSSNAYLIAVASTTITFLVIGAMKSKWSTEYGSLLRCKRWPLVAVR